MNHASLLKRYMNRADRRGPSSREVAEFHDPVVSLYVSIILFIIIITYHFVGKVRLFFFESCKTKESCYIICIMYKSIILSCVHCPFPLCHFFNECYYRWKWTFLDVGFQNPLEMLSDTVRITNKGN